MFGKSRLRRLHYGFWQIILFSMLIIIAFCSAAVTPQLEAGSSLSEMNNTRLFLLIILCIFVTASHIIELFVTIQRLHDCNLSGWWALIIFVPLISTIFVLVMIFIPGTVGANRFGNDPKLTDDLESSEQKDEKVSIENTKDIQKMSSTEAGIELKLKATLPERDAPNGQLGNVWHFQTMSRIEKMQTLFYLLLLGLFFTWALVVSL